MRLLICAGGTGGGVYPALTVSETLSKAGHQLLWVGSEGSMDASLVERTGIPFQAIPAAGVHGVSLRKLPGNLQKLARGYQASKKILKEFQPDALLFTGGYVAIPMAFAAIGKKSLLFVPDLEPGLALKVLSYFAKQIAVTAEESRRFFSNQGKVYVTGYPLRDNLKKWNKANGQKYFKFDPKVPTLLFLGGSSGARSINNAVLANIDNLIKKYQVIHLTGRLDWDRVYKETRHLNNRYQAFNYLHEAGAAEAAADLVISRSGASCLGEYPYFGLPAVLAPYPYAWRYQKVNADYLAERDAAVILEDAALNKNLQETIDAIFEEEGRLEKMSQAMKNLAVNDAAEKIANLITKMVEG
ncbi:MAG: undecaprenyldiphospho-muramoylpentapeptide beta-N-acetylglucosaminyltransferase [Anaerolineaceae bacterium]|nr:undecaprenyldiphospho-muramoylpentapeptide beta-N-acetylglucosaminyltransferase [Anaerolineaceae bacterium]